MNYCDPFQTTFPVVLNRGVIEELRAHPQYSFSIEYAKDGWVPMLELHGSDWDDVYQDQVPDCIKTMYDTLAFCQMDDFGNLVERDAFPVYTEGYQVFLAPDPERGEGYYLWMPTIH